MIIIDKTDDVLSYSINAHYFNKFSKAPWSNNSRNFWRMVEGGGSAFTYDVSFSAEDRDSGELFMEYQRRLVLTVKIEDEKKDALEILNIVKEFHDSMKLFIETNSPPHYEELKWLNDYEITDQAITRIEQDIAGLKDMKRFEDKSEDEKRIDKLIENTELKVKTNIKHS